MISLRVQNVNVTIFRHSGYLTGQVDLSTDERALRARELLRGELCRRSVNYSPCRINK